MPKKRNIFFIISAVVLIPVILGLTPVKFVQKLGSGCPLNNNKVALSCNPCIYHSVTSQYSIESDTYYTALLPSDPVIFQAFSNLPKAAYYFEVTEDSNPSIKAPPLRC